MTNNVCKWTYTNLCKLSIFLGIVMRQESSSLLTEQNKKWLVINLNNIYLLPLLHYDWKHSPCNCAIMHSWTKR